MIQKDALKKSPLDIYAELKKVIIPTFRLAAFCLCCLVANTINLDSVASASQITYAISEQHLSAHEKQVFIAPQRVAPTCKEQSGAILLDFEGLGNIETVGTAYNECGAFFSEDSLSIVDADAGGTGNFANEPSPNTTLFFLNSDRATLNFPAGIVNGFSFYYAAIHNAGFIKVYSEVDRGGVEIAHLDLPLTPKQGNGDPSGDFDNWQKIGVSFAGLAKSIDFGGTANQIGFDNITLNSPDTADTKISSFTFDLIDDHNVDEIFTIRVTARDQYGNIEPTFNEAVSIVANCGAAINILSEQGVKLINGVWTGEVSVSEPGNNIQLYASYEDISGLSNRFNINSATIPESNIGGVVYLASETVDGATVRLIDLVTQEVVNETGSSANGSYSFHDVIPGTYFLTAVKNENISTERIVFIRNHLSYRYDLYLRTQKPPLLIVPGILGSTQKDAPDNQTYPELNFQVGEPSADDLKPLDPTKFGVRKVALKEFKDEMSATFEVFYTPYDWRLSIQDAAVDYLKPAIEKAKLATGHDKVFIVAHSMGGLLARAYIQSQQYDNDIEKLVMLGTPNNGSANMYMISEGGEPKRVDDLLNEGLGGTVTFWINLYHKSVKHSYEFLENKEYSEKNLDVITFIGQKIKSARQLLPTYGFLNVEDSNDPPGKIISMDNFYLKGLNGAPTKKRIVSSAADATTCTEDCVETRLFLTHNEKTIEQIHVKEREEPPASIYPDGEPYDPSIPGNELIQEMIGDGTVVASHASSPFSYDNSIVVTGSFGEHASLFSSDQIKQRILGFFTNGSIERSDVATAKHQVAALPESNLSISITGGVQPYLIDPDGRTIGVNPSSRDIEKNIPAATIGLAKNYSALSLADPSDGVYRIMLQGPVACPFTVKAIFTGSEDHDVEQKTFGFFHGDTISFSISFASDDDEPVHITDPVEPPSNVASRNDGSNTRLSWAASGDSDTVSYNVYRRKASQPKYALFANTVDTTYLTSDPWNGDDDISIFNYIVTSVSQDGHESFYTKTVENSSMVTARFRADKTHGEVPLTVRFSDQSEGDVIDWDWDFNGDGIFEVSDANPSFTFSEPGEYTVKLVVYGTSDQDQVVKTNYISVSEASNISGEDRSGGGSGCFIDTSKNSGL